MKNQVFKSSLVIAISIIGSSIFYRTKPDFHFNKDNWVATIKTNRTNGERCLLADGVFRTWTAADIQQGIERIKFELRGAPLDFCSGETPPDNIKLK